MGFFLTPEIARRMIESEPKEREVIKPAMGGEELNNSASLTPSRWIIDMGERSESDARIYNLAFQHLEQFVKPERLTKDAERYPRLTETWWKYWHSRGELYSGITKYGLSRVLVRARISDHHMMAFLPNNFVYTEQLAVFLFDQWCQFAWLQSSLHEVWLRRYASTLKSDVRYIPTDCFGTFPLPMASGDTDRVGELFYNDRSCVMMNRNEGLTTIYNRLHDPRDVSADIQRLRELQVEMDNATSVAYGWADIPLDHGFRETSKGVRYTIGQSARLAVLERLLNLNHARYAQEVSVETLQSRSAAAPKSHASKRKRPSDSAQNDFFAPKDFE
jgi:hypothetical protein